MHSFRPRYLVILGLTVLLAASLSVSATDSSDDPVAQPAEEGLFVPEAEPMGECITCEGSYQTPDAWGKGEDCGESLNDLESQVNADAFDFCRNTLGLIGACDVQVIITGSCTYSNGEFVTDGHGIHGCLEGDYFCPEW